jgi:thioredoxin reductase (NADPH)
MSLKLETKPLPKKNLVPRDDHYDLMIIGGGPAGLAAALYAARFRLKTVLIEKMIVGGMASTTYKIENYPGFPEGVSGLDLSQKMAEQVTRLGVPIIYGQALKLKNLKNEKRLLVDSRTISAKAVILASGTLPSRLGIPGEKEFVGRGVSYCATCDGPFYQDKHIMVIGGGNAAVEEALFLTRYGSKVSIVHRRDELRADRIVAERAKEHPKIYFFWHSVLEEIRGEQKVQAAVLQDLLSGKKLNIPVEGIFIYVGTRPQSELVKGLVKTDKQGYILTDEKLSTSAAGIFAAGDIRVKTLRQVVTAAADGAIAANSAREYLENGK